MDTLPFERPIRTAPELTADLEGLGVPRGGLVMVHSSLRSIGTVDGGAATVVDALLAALGPTGTLVAPTFTGQFRDPGFIFDPAETPGTTGAIPNHVFRRPEARRTVHIVQTVAAIGPLRDDIVDAGGQDGWDAQPSMRAIFDLDGWFLLLGVPYQNLTAGHFMEQEIGYTPAPPRGGGTPAQAGRPRRPSAQRVRGDPTSASPACPSAATTSTGWARAWSSADWCGAAPSATPSPDSSAPETWSAPHGEIFAANPELFFIVDGQVTTLQYGTTWPIPEGTQRRRGALHCWILRGCISRRMGSGWAPHPGAGYSYVLDSSLRSE